MNVLILGSGGREHAFAWKIRQSPQCDALWIAPGNGGTAALGTNIDLRLDDFESIYACIIEHRIDLLIVGPEAPLVDGVRDFLLGQEGIGDLIVVGPGKSGAQLEGSKDFAKAFMNEFGIPTAQYRSFDRSTADDGLAFIRSFNGPIVLKADGLAAGKGVLIIEDHDAATRSFRDMLNGRFGAAGNTVIIEEFLSGIEFSVFALTDGLDYVVLPVAKDYKRIGEGDTGLNTGGMGAISPVPFVDDAVMEKVRSRIIEPSIRGIQKRALDYSGFLFFGLILVGEDPYVIEYNCRMGDPETEVVLPRIRNDLIDVFRHLKNQTLHQCRLDIDPRFVSTVMLASEGYPEQYEKGKVIRGAKVDAQSLLFHAGTAVRDGDLVTAGGRVMAVSCYGNDMQTALRASYTHADQIRFEGKYYRRDIGFDLQ